MIRSTSDMRRLQFLFLLIFASPLLGQDAPKPAAVPQALAALEHLTPRPDSGPFSWTNGPYTYDGAGNITSIGSEAYVYDKLGRIKSATLRGPDLGGMQTQTFDYDAYGNLIGTARVGQPVDLTTSVVTNQLGILGYDAAGNVIDAGNEHFRHGAIGMTNAVLIGENAQPSVIYGYTADDERLFAFDVSTGATHWTVRGFDNKVLRDFKQVGAAWSVERDYVYRDGLLLAAMKPGGVEHYSLDHLGTVRLVTDGTGNKIGYHVYWPFGEEWSVGSPQDGSPLRFTGHERDADPTGGSTPLDYMHARYYGAVWGRFLSVDPALDLKKTMPNPQTWNRYTYVINNPLRYTDPDGRDTWDRINGFANAFGSDNLLGAGRVGGGNDDYKAGQHAGDFTASVTGLIEVGLGGTGATGSTLASMTGVGAVVGAPAAVVSGTVVVHGATTTLIATAHMMSAAESGKKAGDLISGSLKKSKSYRSELENSTKAEIDKLAKDKGPFQQAARQMKKLIEQAERLRDKIRS